jgi:hypothetical protein
MNSTILKNLSETEQLSLYEIPNSIIFIFSLAYYSISVWSVLGNCLIVWAVFYNKRMHNVTNFFIVNIALADIIISLFCTPFQFHAAILQVHFLKIRNSLIYIFIFVQKLPYFRNVFFLRCFF